MTGCVPAGGAGRPDRSGAEPTPTAPNSNPPAARTDGGPTPRTSTVSVGGITLHISSPQAANVQADVAGLGTRTVTMSLIPGGSAELTLDSSGELDVDPDGSITVLDSGGTPVAALSPPAPAGDGTGDTPRIDVIDTDVTHARLELDDRPVRLTADGTTEGPGDAAPVPFTFVVGTEALESATWGENEGGRSLAVDPADWARHAGEAGLRLVRAQLVAVAPEAGSETMGHQLVCHGVGAPEKPTWNLEPWRPDVGLILTATAHCNPV